jgi:hypothetical protein
MMGAGTVRIGGVFGTTTSTWKEMAVAPDRPLPPTRAYMTVKM